jgi:hypothetical protein
VNEFVEACRREWRRLRVPDPVADEMAAELAADLSEAAAEGAHVEDVLGSFASDPRGLAADWAEARGTMGRSARREHRGTAAAILALAAVAIAGAVLLFTASDSSATRRELLPPPSTSRTRLVVIRPTAQLAGRGVWVTAAPAVQATERDETMRKVGLVLSTAALAAIVLLASAWLWRDRRAGV